MDGTVCAFFRHCGSLGHVEIVSYCPDCLRATRLDSGAAPSEFRCGKCGAKRTVSMTESVASGNVVDRCVLCGCGHLYLEKDFNGYVGFAVVVTAIVASALFWAKNVYIAVSILGAAALVDLAFWVGSRERTVCYRCVATYRGASPNPAHGRYELGTAGRFADDYDEQRGLHQK